MKSSPDTSTSDDVDSRSIDELVQDPPGTAAPGTLLGILDPNCCLTLEPLVASGWTGDVVSAVDAPVTNTEGWRSMARLLLVLQKELLLLAELVTLSLACLLADVARGTIPAPNDGSSKLIVREA